jgi:hypothetical protein
MPTRDTNRRDFVKLTGAALAFAATQSARSDAKSSAQTTACASVRS